MHFACFSIARNGPEWNFQIFIFPLSSRFVRATSTFTRFSNNVLAVFQVKQRPDVSVTTNNDVSTTSAVSTIGTSAWDELFSVHVSRTSTAGSRATTDFYVIDKV